MNKKNGEYIPTAKDVYRNSTTHFRKRRINKKALGASLLILAAVAVIALSVIFIVRGGDYKKDRQAKIMESVDNTSAGAVDTVPYDAHDGITE